MSNLKLPTMTFARLSNEGQGLKLDGTAKTIAYATTAEYVAKDGSTDAYVIIRHHGTVIAEIARGWVYVTNAGYTSQTTRGRIHKILTDNRQDYGFLVLGQNKGDQVLSFRKWEGLEENPWGGVSDIFAKDQVLTRNFFSAHWDFENRTVEHGAERIGTIHTVTL